MIVIAVLVKINHEYIYLVFNETDSFIHLAVGYNFFILCSSISLSKVIREIPCSAENL